MHNPRRRRVAEQKLKAYLEEHPDAYLREIAVEFEVSATAIMYACRRYNITRKKRPRAMPNGMKQSVKLSKNS